MATGPWTQIATGIACTSGIQASYAWATTSITSGTYYVRAAVSDGAGGSGADVSDASFRITAKDHTLPAAPVVSSPTHPDRAAWYNNNAPTFNWTAPSDESGINGYSYILNQTAITTPDTASEGTAVTKHYTGMASGVWYFHVRARDGAGNWGPAAHYTVRIDTVVPGTPMVTCFTHPSQTTWYDNRNPVFNWTMPADLTGISGYSYVLNHTATTVPSTVITSTAATVSYSDTAVGTWYFHVRAADGAGNWGAATHYTIHIDASL